LNSTTTFHSRFYYPFVTYFVSFLVFNPVLGQPPFPFPSSPSSCSLAAPQRVTTAKLWCLRKVGGSILAALCSFFVMTVYASLHREPPLLRYSSTPGMFMLKDGLTLRPGFTPQPKRLLCRTFSFGISRFLRASHVFAPLRKE